jgi:hypothetical protein
MVYWKGLPVKYMKGVYLVLCQSKIQLDYAVNTNFVHMTVMMKQIVKNILYFMLKNNIKIL